MNFLEKLSINVNYTSNLPEEIFIEYDKLNYDIKIGKIKINKKNSVKDDIDSLVILNEINKNFDFKNNPNQCNNFWQENIMQKIEDAIFISDYLKLKIKNSLNYELKLQWYNIENQLTGYYSIFFESLSDILDFINKLKTLIKITIFMFDKMTTNKNINVVKTFFFLTDFKKKINWGKKETIGKHHVNSGMTSYKIVEDISCCLDNYVLLWRKEEILKVYIHELIHYLKIDSKSKFKIDFNYNFCLFSQVNILPNEAYTDFLAIILNSIVYSFVNDSKLKKNLINDIKFSIFQTAKILHYFRFSKWSDFQNSNCNLYLKQNSNVFPYYIIKAALLFNFDKTINLLKEITFDNTFYFNLNSSKKNLKKLEEHIIYCLSDSKFSDEIDKLINMFKNLDVKSNKIILNTLKMTILD